MSLAMYSLTLKHPDLETEEIAHSDSEVILRLLGRAHHRAAQIKPDMTLTDPYGATLATMECWATDWSEARS